ncbi:MAG: hypothetical protein RL637_1620 [Pseudomonadota bacterium]|jgi:outer membrane receptor protein involved in Fe transport
MTVIRIVLYCLWINILFYQTVFARDDSALEEEIRYLQAERMVEVVSKQKEDRNTAAGIVSIITGRDIERYGGNNLFEILNRITSVYMIGNPIRTMGVASMRGDPIAQHVLVLMNGRPIRDSAFGGTVDGVFRDFPIHHIKKIEVIRGPGSVLYGSNAFSGVINIVTLKKPDYALTFRGRYGSFDLTQFETEFGYENKENQALISGAIRYRQRNGELFSANRQILNSNGTITFPHSEFRNNNGENTSASLTAEWGNLSLNSFFSHSERNHWGPGRIQTGQVYEPQRLFLDVGYKKQVNENWLSQWNLTYNQIADVQYVPKPKTSIVTPTFTRTAENNLLFEPTQFFNFLDKTLNITLGGLVEWQSGKINQAEVGATLPEYHYLKSSVYGEVNYNFNDQLKLIAGGQWNHFEDLSKPVAAGFLLNNTQLQKNGLVGRLGLIYEFTPEWGMKFLYSQAFRSPAIVEMKINAGPIRGNPNLQPETVETIDGQLFYRTKDSQISLTAFRSHQSQFIAMVCPAVGDSRPCSYNNQGGAIYQGIEFETALRLLPDLSFTSSYTFQMNSDSNQNNNVSAIPNHLAKMGLNYDFNKNWQLGLFDIFVSDAKVINAIKPNPTPKAYHYLTLNTNYHLDHLFDLPELQRINFNLYLENLFNAKVYYSGNRADSFNSIPSGYTTRMIFGEIAINF